MVEVVFGAESLKIPACCSVKDIRDTLKHALNIPAAAKVKVNGEAVTDDHVPPDGACVEFYKQAGSKRGEWAAESELTYVHRLQLDEFRRTHKSPQDWGEQAGQRWYRETAIHAAFGPPPPDKLFRDMERLSRLGQGKPLEETELDRGMPNLPRAVRLAYLSWLYAAQSIPNPADHEAYRWFKEQEVSPTDARFGDLALHDPPPFESWVRQVRKARKSLGTNKNLRRQNRVADIQGVVRLDEIEHQYNEGDD